MIFIILCFYFCQGYHLFPNLGIVLTPNNRLMFYETLGHVQSQVKIEFPALEELHTGQFEMCNV